MYNVIVSKLHYTLTTHIMYLFLENVIFKRFNYLNSSQNLTRSP